jgi:hypothetical protein
MGSAVGNPEAHFYFGRVTWGTASGWIDSRRIVYTTTLILDLPPLVTRIGYTWEAGVQATVQELVIQP